MPPQPLHIKFISFRLYSQLSTEHAPAFQCKKPSIKVGDHVPITDQSIRIQPGRCSKNVMAKGR